VAGVECRDRESRDLRDRFGSPAVCSSGMAHGHGAGAGRLRSQEGRRPRCPVCGRHRCRVSVATGGLRYRAAAISRGGCRPVDLRSPCRGMDNRCPTEASCGVGWTGCADVGCPSGHGVDHRAHLRSCVSRFSTSESRCLSAGIRPAYRRAAWSAHCARFPACGAPAPVVSGRGRWSGDRCCSVVRLKALCIRRGRLADRSSRCGICCERHAAVGHVAASGEKKRQSRPHHVGGICGTPGFGTEVAGRPHVDRVGCGPRRRDPDSGRPRRDSGRCRSERPRAARRSRPSGPQEARRDTGDPSACRPFRWCIRFERRRPCRAGTRRERGRERRVLSTGRTTADRIATARRSARQPGEGRPVPARRAVAALGCGRGRRERVERRRLGYLRVFHCASDR